MSRDGWERAVLATGGILAATAVAAGAFGAHLLRNRLGPSELDTFQTAARYHMYHALAILVLPGLLAGRGPALFRAAFWCFLAGIVLFSGSLYVLAVTRRPWLGAITPVGGALLLAGWGCLAAGGLRRRG